MKLVLSHLFETHVVNKCVLSHRMYVRMNAGSRMNTQPATTLGSLINVRVLIIVRGGRFGQNNKHTGPNKHTVKKI